MLASASADDVARGLGYFAERFGLGEEAFAGHRFFLRARTIWAAADSPTLSEALEKLALDSVGIPLLRFLPGGPKPTTRGLQVFGGRAVRNVADLAPGDLARLLRGELLGREFPCQPGYVILRSEGQIIGCGLYGRQGLRSQIPRGFGGGGVET